MSDRNRQSGKSYWSRHVRQQGASSSPTDVAGAAVGGFSGGIAGRLAGGVASGLARLYADYSDRRRRAQMGNALDLTTASGNDGIYDWMGTPQSRKPVIRQTLAHNQPYTSRDQARRFEAHSRGEPAPVSSRDGMGDRPQERARIGAVLTRRTNMALKYPYKPWHPASKKKEPNVDTAALASDQQGITDLIGRIRQDEVDVGARAWRAARMVANRTRDAARERGIDPNSLEALQVTGDSVAQEGQAVAQAHDENLRQNRALEAGLRGQQASLRQNEQSIKMQDARLKMDQEEHRYRIKMAKIQEYLAARQAYGGGRGAF